MALKLASLSCETGAFQVGISRNTAFRIPLGAQRNNKGLGVQGGRVPIHEIGRRLHRFHPLVQG
jgi:hypothetical protein